MIWALRDWFGAAQQLIQPDAPIAFFSWCLLRRRLDAVRGAPVNSGVGQLHMTMKISFALALLITFGVAFRANAADCSVGNIHFACPKNFKPVPLDSTQQFALYYWKKYDVGLFVASPTSDYDESKFMTNVIRTSLAKMFPKDTQTFSWKGVAYSGRISKFEIDGSVVQGFNGSRGVLIKYRRLKINGSDIIVGYVSEFGRGAQAKESFARGLGGDSMPGCYAAVDTIYSITGEKMPENNPCDLVVEIR